LNSGTDYGAAGAFEVAGPTGLPIEMEAVVQRQGHAV
jgi:hypothetical protein